LSILNRMRLSANRHDQISVSDGSVTHVGIALTFGLIVTAMIYSIGDVWGPYQSGGDNRVLDIGTACSARSSCLCNCSNCWSDLGKCIIASPVFRSPRSRDDITCWPLVEIVRLPSRANLYLDVRHPELFNRCEFDRNLYRRCSWSHRWIGGLVYKVAIAAQVKKRRATNWLNRKKISRPVLSPSSLN